MRLGLTVPIPEDVLAQNILGNVASVGDRHAVSGLVFNAPALSTTPDFSNAFAKAAREIILNGNIAVGCTRTLTLTECAKRVPRKPLCLPGKEARGVGRPAIDHDVWVVARGCRGLHDHAYGEAIRPVYVLGSLIVADEVPLENWVGHS